jgi:hypothetical protein
MLKLYYKIWVDCILSGMRQPNNRRNVLIKSMIFMSIAMVFNLFFFMILLQKYVLKTDFYNIRISSSSKYINTFFSVLSLYILPTVILNYFLIIRNDRYKKLLKKFPSRNGNLFSIYFSTSLLIPAFLVFLGSILTHIFKI